MSLPDRPSNCRCPYPSMLSNNPSLHAADCPAYRTWKRRRQLAARKLAATGGVWPPAWKPPSDQTGE